MKRQFGEQRHDDQARLRQDVLRHLEEAQQELGAADDRPRRRARSPRLRARCGCRDRWSAPTSSRGRPPGRPCRPSRRSEFDRSAPCPRICSPCCNGRLHIAGRAFSAALAMRLDDGLTSSQINGEPPREATSADNQLPAATANDPAVGRRLRARRHPHQRERTMNKYNGSRNGALRVLVVGVGNMGASDARAYDKIDGFELAGLCARTIAKRADLSPSGGPTSPAFPDTARRWRRSSPTSSRSTPGRTRTPNTRSRRSRPARTCSWRSRSPRPWPTTRKRRRRRPSGEEEARDRLHPARPPVLGRSSSSSPRASASRWSCA